MTRKRILTVAIGSLILAATQAASAATPEWNGMALKTAVMRLERTNAAEDRAECRRLAEKLFADAGATNLAAVAQGGDARLLDWFLGVDACATSKAVDVALKARAKQAVDAFVPAIWPTKFAALGAPTALFACRAIWRSTDALGWGDCFGRYDKLREDPFLGDATNRLDVCALGGFAPGAKPTPEELLATQLALHELCRSDRDGFAIRKFRDGLDRNAAAVRALEKTHAAAAELARACEGFEVRTNELTTAWGRKVTPENAWREYPRPQMVREGAWRSLNGTWDLTIEPSGEKAKILVPFPVESPLSGVHRKVLPTDELVYRRAFAAKRRPGFRTLLHFEAVDFRAQVFVNGVEATDVPHEGGCAPFSLDVTDLLAADGGNALEVRVWDPTDTFINSTGKQTLQMRTCFFPASSGIIGSVWTEEAPETHLECYHVTADPDTGKVVVTPTVKGNLRDARVTVDVLDRPAPDGGGVVVSGVQTRCDRPVVLQLPKPWRRWSCAKPELYGLRVTVAADGREDRVTGYFGVRQLKVWRDAKGVAKLALNGEPVYLLGVLDQGYWPDGYLTPPSEDACRWDVDFLKDVGVNCIRKHIKVEPRCFYAHCDRKGVLVLQDMPSAWHDGVQHDRARANTRYGFARRELKEIVDHLGNHPSIVCWIPYNESWSQPDEAKTFSLGRWLKRYDPTRLIDLASGWSHFEDGWETAWKYDKALERPTSEFVTDIVDWHEYPGPKIAQANPDRAIICGEFGAMAGGAVDGHYFDVRGRAVKIVPDTPEGLADVRERNRVAYRAQTDRVLKQVREGSSGSILCEDVDCFWEGGGYVSFDRAVERFDRAELRAFHQEVYDAYAAEARATPAMPQPAEFGLDNCPGKGSGARTLSVHTPEAWWCCTMRGGEGLSRALQYAFFTEGDVVFAVQPQSCTFTAKLPKGELAVEEVANYPFGANVTFKILSNTAGEATLRVLLGGLDKTFRRDFKAGEEIVVALPHAPHREPVVQPENCEKGDFRMMDGPLVLGRFPDGALRPIHHVLDPKYWQGATDSKPQVLFDAVSAPVPAG